MPEKVDKSETVAPDAEKVIRDALLAAGFANATVRVSPGVHDAVITIIVPKEG